MKWADALAQVLAENPGLPSLSPAQREGLVLHAELLVRWNKVHNLTRVDSPLEVARRHWADSLAGLAALESAVPDLGPLVFDVGSGAGFPGLAAALLWPERQLVLVEAARKRASFLQRVGRELGLTNLRVENARQEEVPAGAADVVLTRATLPWQRLPELMPLLRPGGWLGAWSAAEPSHEEWRERLRGVAGASAASAGRAPYHVQSLPERAVLLAQQPPA